MTKTDIVTIIGNLSQSLYPVQKLISGGAYVLGIMFFIIALNKLLKLADKRAQSSSEKVYPALIYLLMGAFLIYTPTILRTLTNTFFGVGSVISYTEYDPTNFFSSMALLVRTAGLLWFVRGCVLLVHTSEPGSKLGSQGLAFIFAGILAMNFESSLAAVSYIINILVSWTVSFKTRQGY